MINIGFTGTQEGMTPAQSQTVFDEMMLYGQDPDDWVAEAHHGLCVGADEQFHRLLSYMHKSLVVHGHPPINRSKVANCDVDVMHPPLEYLARNREIVEACTVLFAAPKGQEALRSGTWSTVRYARRIGKPIRIVWPDGISSFDRGRGGYRV